ITSARVIVLGALHKAQAIFCRRRHQPRRPPPAKIRPGSPAPATGPGTANESTPLPVRVTTGCPTTNVFSTNTGGMPMRRRSVSRPVIWRLALEIPTVWGLKATSKVQVGDAEEQLASGVTEKDVF